jgi:hypothetical protein
MRSLSATVQVPPRRPTDATATATVTRDTMIEKISILMKQILNRSSWYIFMLRRAQYRRFLQDLMNSLIKLKC